MSTEWCNIYDEKIETLKSIVVKQQRAVNKIDAGDREKYIIISGMNEDNIEDDVAVYVNDEQKISALFKVIGIALPENYSIQRLGKQNTEYRRIIKMDVTNKSIRDEILKHVKVLKAKGSPWDVIYMKKDLHKYSLLSRTIPLSNKVGRGGVAVYIKNGLNVKCRVFENICPDAVIFEIKNTDTTLISPYIAPENSSYKNHEIFSIINFIIKNFKNKHVCLIGDLNSRCGTPDIDPSKVYIHNPDGGGGGGGGDSS